MPFRVTLIVEIPIRRMKNVLTGAVIVTRIRFGLLSSWTGVTVMPPPDT